MKFTVFGYTITVERIRAAAMSRELAFPRTAVIRLPRLVGSRDTVIALFDDQRIPHNLVNVKLVVSGRDCTSLSKAAADEIVRQAVSRKAPRLYHIGMTQAFSDALMDAAEHWGVVNPRFFVRQMDPLDLPPSSEWVME